MTNTHRLWRRKLYLQKYLKGSGREIDLEILKVLEENPKDWRNWVKSCKSID